MAEKSYQNFIDGQWVDGSGTQPIADINPADTREIIGCGMPHIFRKQHTWNELMRDNSALFSRSVSKL